MALEVEVHHLPGDPRVLSLQPHDGSLNRLFTCKHCFHNLTDQTIDYLDISENLGTMSYLSRWVDRDEVVKPGEVIGNILKQQFPPS